MAITKRKIKSILISVLIVIFWVTMMTILFKRYIISDKNAEPIELSPYDLSVKWKDKEQWMSISLNGKPIGIYLLDIKKKPQDNEFEITNRLAMTITMLSQEIPISMDSCIYLREDFVLKEFIIDIRALIRNIRIHGLTSGTELYLRWNNGTRDSYNKIDLQKQVSFYNAIIPALSRNNKLAVGNSFRVAAYDPIWQSVGGDVVFHVKSKENLTFENREFQTFRVETTMNNTKTTAWILPSGEVLKQELPYGITLMRIGREAALKAAPELHKPISFKRLNKKEFLSRSVSILDKNMPLSDKVTSETMKLNLSELAFGSPREEKSPAGIFGFFGTLFDKK